MSSYPIKGNASVQKDLSVGRQLQLGQLTTGVRDAIASPADGSIIYNTDTLQPEVYNQGAWGGLGGQVTQVRLDASLSGIVQELPSAAGSNNAFLYISEDVTNSAQLIPPSGEMLNDVTYPGSGNLGTFFFNNYAAGTSFLATDRAIGKWDIAVVGAATETRNGARFELTEADIQSVWGLTASSLNLETEADGGGCVFPFQSARYNEGWTLASPTSAQWVDNGLTQGFANRINDTYMQPDSDGLYRFTFNICDAVNADVNNSSQGPLIACLAIDGTIVQYFDNNSDGDAFRMSFVHQVNAGQKVQVGIVSANLDGGDSFTFAGNLDKGDANLVGTADIVLMSVDIEVAQPKEVILAGSVPTTALSFYHDRLNADTSVTAGNPIPFNENLFVEGTGISHAAGVFTLAANKLYRLVADVKVDQTGVGFLHQWRDITNGTLIGTSAQSLATDSAVGAAQHSLAVAYIKTTVVTQVQVENTEGATRTARANSNATVEELPISTVVNPDALVPQTLHRARLRLAAATATVLGDNDLIMDTEDYDVGDIASGGIVTIVNSGTYHVAVRGGNATVSNNNQIYIKVNGVKTVRARDTQVTQGEFDTLYMATTINLNIGDVVQAGIYTSGAHTTSADLEDQCALEVTQIPDQTVVAYTPTQVEAKALPSVYISRRGADRDTAVHSVSTGSTNDWNILGGLLEYTASDAAAANGGMVVGTNQVTIPETGNYRIEASVTTEDTVAGSHGTIIQISDGTTVLAANGHVETQNLEASSQAVYEGQLVAGTVIDFRLQSSTTTIDVNSMALIVRQLPTTEVVTPGDVPVEDLDHITVALSASAATVSDGTYFRIPFDVTRSTSGTSLSLSSGKVPLTAGVKYELSAMIVTSNQGELAFWDFTNDVALSDSYHNADDANSRGSFQTIVTPSTNIEVGIVTRVSETIVGTAAFGTLTANFSNSWMTVRKLASKTITYLNPAFTEAKDLSHFNIYELVSTQQGGGIDGQSFTVSSGDLGVVGDPIFFGDGTVSSGGSGLSSNGSDTLTVVESGRYRIWGSYGADGVGGNEIFYQILVNGAIASEQGVYILTTNDTNASSVEYIADLAAGDTIQWGIHSSSSGDLQLINYNFTVEQLPSTEYVTPGDVPVEDLHFVSLSCTSLTAAVSVATTTIGSGYRTVDLDDTDLTQVYDPNGLINTTDNSFTLLNDGKYEISFGADYDNAASSGGAIYVDGVIRGVIRPTANGSDQDRGTVSIIADLTAGQKIEVAISGTDSGSITSPYVTLKQLSAKTVVDPTAVPADNTGVVDKDTLAWNATNTQYEPVTASRLLYHADDTDQDITVDVTVGNDDLPSETVFDPYSLGTAANTITISGLKAAGEYVRLSRLLSSGDITDLFRHGFAINGTNVWLGVTVTASTSQFDSGSVVLKLNNGDVITPVSDQTATSGGAAVLNLFRHIISLEIVAV